jgi:hypothetical protein
MNAEFVSIRKLNRNKRLYEAYPWDLIKDFYSYFDPKFTKDLNSELEYFIQIGQEVSSGSYSDLMIKSYLHHANKGELLLWVLFFLYYHFQDSSTQEIISELEKGSIANFQIVAKVLRDIKALPIEFLNQFIDEIKTSSTHKNLVFEVTAKVTLVEKLVYFAFDGIKKAQKEGRNTYIWDLVEIQTQAFASHRANTNLLSESRDMPSIGPNLNFIWWKEQSISKLCLATGINRKILVKKCELKDLNIPKKGCFNVNILVLDVWLSSYNKLDVYVIGSQLMCYLYTQRYLPESENDKIRYNTVKHLIKRISAVSMDEAVKYERIPQDRVYDENVPILFKMSNIWT